MNIYSIKALPYVYLCEHKITKEFYYGSRCANKINSSIDFPRYKTSSKKVKPRFNEFDWIILAEFFEASDAYDYEQLLIYENWNNPLSLNNSCFHLKKRLRCIVHSEKTLEIMRLIPKRRTSDITKEKQRIVKLGTNNARFGVKGIDHPNYGKTPYNKGISQYIVICPHCNKSGGSSAMKRYHFDNCKLLKTCKVE